MPNSSVRKYPAPVLGDKFGRWSIVEEGVTHKGGQYYLHVECECGARKLVLPGNLRSGKSRSCGCLSRELKSARAKPDQVSDHPQYQRWRGIISRCTNPNSAQYSRYGGRGISVSEDWMTFCNFHRDMGDPPFDGASIDRIDNDKGYSKENCRWATSDEQSRNKRCNVFYTYGGDTLLLKDFAVKYNANYSTLASRIYCYNMTMKQALEMPRQFTNTPLGVGLPADG